MCAGIIYMDEALVIISYLGFSLFVIQIYTVWDRDWKSLAVVAPIALVKPIIIIVRMCHSLLYSLSN